jgi:hypothetical protein
MYGLQYPVTPTNSNNMYLYDGKELQQEMELDWYDYGTASLRPLYGAKNV